MNLKKATGLIFAMKEEQTGLEKLIQHKKSFLIANREFIQGDLWGNPVISVLSGIGKVAAATTTSLLLQTFKLDQVILSGVAGACDPSLRVGDIVIAEKLLQHDMDASPLFPRFEIPLSGKTYFKTNENLTEGLQIASQHFLNEDIEQLISKMNREKFKLNQIQIKKGLIASGDQFINNQKKLLELKQALPELLAIEMEGAAIAQVCHDFNIAFAILRTISDNANDEAHIDFQAFVAAVAAPYSLGILRRYFGDKTV